MLANRLLKRRSGLGRFLWLLVTPSLAFQVKLNHWRVVEHSPGTNGAKHAHFPIQTCLRHGPAAIWQEVELAARPVPGANVGSFLGDLGDRPGTYRVSVRRVRSSSPMTMSSFDAKSLQGMSRKDLQSIAKQAGVKANMKSSAIISELVSRTEEKSAALHGADAGEPVEQPVHQGDVTISAEVLRETLNATSTDGVLSLLERAASSADFPQSASVWHDLISAASDGSSGKMASLYNCVLSVLGSTDAHLCHQLLRGMRCTPDTVSASLAAAACIHAGDDAVADEILRDELARAGAARRAAGIERQLKKRQRAVQQSSKSRRQGTPGAHPLEVAVGGDGGALKVLYEDAGLVVVSKPSAMLVHPTTSTPLKGPGAMTVCDGLLCAYGWEGVSWLGEYAGVVHRLDRGTSGVMVLAKTARAHALLVSAFFGRKVKKEYHALVPGRPSWGSEGQEVEAEVDGLWARSTCRTIEQFEPKQRGEGAACLVAVRPEQGRKHQVRVHLAKLGHPLFLDPLYGDSRLTGYTSRRKAKQSPRRPPALPNGANPSVRVPCAVEEAGAEWRDGRFCLHAARLSLPSSLLHLASRLPPPAPSPPHAAAPHASTEEERTEWAAAPPDWFQHVQASLRPDPPPPAP